MVKPIMKDVIFLARRSQPATKADTAIGRDLLDTLRANAEGCVGLAANMIGSLKRIVAIGVPVPMVLYNPVILEKSDPYPAREGCLSLAGERETTRCRRILVRYQDAGFRERTEEFTGFAAQCLQHEMDHLDGILI